MLLSERLRPRRLASSVELALILLAGGALVWALGPRLTLPPRTITLATGPDGGAYAELGPRYQKILAREGVNLRLLPTRGDVENLMQLRDSRSGVSAAFVQAGIANDEDKARLVSLGTLMYAPLWIFVRGDHQGLAMLDLVGKRASIGPEGSGTRFLVLRFLALVGVDPRNIQLTADGPSEGERALLQGETDAFAISTSWEAPVVRRLLADPRVALVSFPRADAYVALNPTLSKLVVPMGVGDLAKNLPREDVSLLATKTSLLVREDLHPALQSLLMEAAAEIHGAPSLFQRASQFPAAEALDVPLSADARQFYKSGPPFLQRYFPFWLAVLFERLIILLIPLVGLLYPAYRTLPDLYRKQMQRRLLSLYGELKLLEGEIESTAREGNAGALRERIESLEARASRLRLPRSFTQSVYHLREHIRFVEARLDRLAGDQKPSPPTG